MNGPGTAPPQPRPTGNGAAIALRFLFVGIALFSCGLLCWVPLLRLAIMRKKAVDWVLCPVVLIAWTTLLVIFGEEDNIDSTLSDVTFGGLGVLAFAVSVYYLVMDIRHHRAVAHRTAVPYAPAYPPTPYNLYCATPAPAPQPAAPPRIDQVRAELDEISDLLREQEGER